MATFAVTNPSNSGPGSLRAAILAANDDPGIALIVFDPGVFGPGRPAQTIRLATQIDISGDVTIRGPGPDHLTIRGMATAGAPTGINQDVFRIAGRDIEVRLSGLTIEGGEDGVEIIGSSRGVLLTVADARILRQIDDGIEIDGAGSTITVSNTFVEGSEDNVTIEGRGNTFFFTGSTTRRGREDGIEVDGSDNILTVTDSTLSENGRAFAAGTRAERDDGIGIDGDRNIVLVRQSTLSGNSGDGISVVKHAATHPDDPVVVPEGNRVSVSNSTVTGNARDGVAVLESPSSAAAVRNTVVAGNARDDVAGDVTSLGHNVVSKIGASATGFAGPGDQVVADGSRVVGPLQDNGGRTSTHAPLPGSPAINAGDPGFAPPPAFDQRGGGFPRVLDGRIDVGAVEARGQGSVAPGTLLASASPAGAQGSGESEDPSLSADGRLVAFSSDASNLTLENVAGWKDIFVKDLRTGEVRLASADATGAQAPGDSTSPSLSADGRFVAFETNATELYPGLEPIFPQGPPFSVILVKNLETGELMLASAAADGTPAIGSSLNPSMSADGRLVAFFSDAANLVPGGDANLSATDVFVKDLQTGALTLASATVAGEQGNGFADDPFISADGRFVAFRSNSSNVIPGNEVTGFAPQVVVKDLATGTVAVASTTAQGALGDPGSSGPSLSADGRFVAFTSDAGNLLPGPDRNGTLASDVFVKDLQTGALTLVSATAGGEQGNRFSAAAADRAISADGQFVAFTSAATNLGPAGDANGTDLDVFVKDLQSGGIALASISSGGVQGDARSFSGSLSADGQFVAFTSLAANLLPSGDTNSPFASDVFVRDTSGDLVGGGGIAFAEDPPPATVGTTGDDMISGTADADRIFGDTDETLFGGRGGDDLVSGLGGADTLFGELAGEMSSGARGGDDTLSGGPGDDRLSGDVGELPLSPDVLRVDFAGSLSGSSRGGDDTLAGGQGDDWIFGDAENNLLNSSRGGDDSLDGGPGDDGLVGDADDMFGFSRGGDDTVLGGPGDDWLHGDAYDELFGFSRGGDDLLDGGQGDDRMFGDAREGMSDRSHGGGDTLLGGTGNDELHGDTQGPMFGDSRGGDDRLDGGPGDDSLHGDGFAPKEAHGGRDTFVFSGVFGEDVVTDFRKGEDRLEFAVPGVDGLEDLRVSLMPGDFGLPDTVITAPGSGTVTLQGFTETLTTADFDFVV